MRIGSFSISSLLKIAACLVLDAAILIFFFNIFALFTVLAPVKSLLMLLVLLASLAIANAAVLFPSAIAKRIGVVHSTSIIITAIAYAIAANLLSILTFAGSIVLYVVLQLIMFAGFLALLSIISFSAKKTMLDKNLDEIEQQGKLSVMMQLIDIETALHNKQTEEGVPLILQSFKELKERINASTPFGRMTGNRAAMDIEQTIQNNLQYIHLQSKLNMTPSIVADVQKLMDETRRLVMHRETLNLR